MHCKMLIMHVLYIILIPFSPHITWFYTNIYGSTIFCYSTALMKHYIACRYCTDMWQYDFVAVFSNISAEKSSFV